MRSNIRNLATVSLGISDAIKMGLQIKHIPNEKLHVSEPDPTWFGNGPNNKSDPNWTSKNWLKSRFHFSFAEYQNPKNLNFGVLRVMNDDLVQPDRGFGTHPHSNMEIFTYVVSGQLTHEDSLGTCESLGRGSVQFMTAGSGVRHSEFNKSPDTPLRFIQTWIVPSRYGLKPRYGSYSPSSKGNEGLEMNKLLHLLSNVDDATTSTPVEISQDVDGYAAQMQKSKIVTHEIPKGRQGYLLCIEGSVKVNDVELKKYDACEITGTGGLLTVEATDVEKTENGDVAHILMFTMKEESNSNRLDL